MAVVPNRIEAGIVVQWFSHSETEDMLRIFKVNSANRVKSLCTCRVSLLSASVGGQNFLDRFRGAPVELLIIIRKKDDAG